MQNIFNELISFPVNIKPEIERAIHTFSAGGGQAGEVQVFVDTFFEEITYEPAVGEIENVPMGMIILALKFPEWLANRDFEPIYQKFKAETKALGLQLEGSAMREVKTYTDLNRSALVREAISKLDTAYETAKNLLQKQ